MILDAPEPPIISLCKVVGIPRGWQNLREIRGFPGGLMEKCGKFQGS